MTDLKAAPAAVVTEPAPKTELVGIISRFFEVKHFGFLRYPGGELFFHQYDVADAAILPKGTRVKFKIGEYNQRPVAINVTPVAPLAPKPLIDGDGGAE